MGKKEVKLFVLKSYHSVALALAMFGGMCLIGCNADNQKPLPEKPAVVIPQSSAAVDTVVVDTVSADTVSVDTVSADSSSSKTEGAISSAAKVDSVPTVKSSSSALIESSSSAAAPVIKDKVTKPALVDTVAKDTVPEEPPVCSDVKPNELCDMRDNKRYLTVRIGKQTWMAQNLDFETEGSWCFGQIKKSCLQYGRLYQWDAVACPDGWHLPSMAEMTALHDFAKAKADAVGKGVGTILKSTSMWDDDEEDDVSKGMDMLGFEARPAGYRRADGMYMSLGAETSYWVSDEDSDPTRAHYWNLYYANEDFIGSYVSVKKTAFSVRCLKD